MFSRPRGGGGHAIDATLDQLYSEALNAVEDDTRLALYRQMDSLVIDAAPAIFLTHNEVLLFLQKEVTGLPIDPLSQLDLRRVRKVE